MWWIVTWSNSQKERIHIYGDELCKLIWIGKVIAIEYDDKYKEEINDSMAEW